MRAIRHPAIERSACGVRGLRFQSMGFGDAGTPDKNSGTSIRDIYKQHNLRMMPANLSTHLSALQTADFNAAFAAVVLGGPVPGIVKPAAPSVLADGILGAIG